MILMPPPSASTILVVDDNPTNIRIVFDFLTAHGYEVSVAQCGESALQILENVQPSMILLDIMMPGLDGFETCRRLKADPKTADIPVIFMTAMSDTADKVKGLSLGAVDYVTKPLQQEEVLARISTHLTICHLQQQLKLKNEELELQNQALVIKNAELDTFAHTVSHNLRNSVNAVVAMADWVLQDRPEGYTEEHFKSINTILQAAEKMTTIIEALLLLAGVSKMTVEIEPLNMALIVKQTQQRLALMINQYRAELVLPVYWHQARGYGQWIEELWMNYLSNAMKYGGQPPRLELGSRLEGNLVRYWVKDNGVGLTAEQQARLFTPFTRLHHKRADGHGLGLTIVQRITEKLGGYAGVESHEGQGSTFYFCLPAIK